MFLFSVLVGVYLLTVCWLKSMGFLENCQQFWMSYKKWIVALTVLMVVGIIIGVSLSSHDFTAEGIYLDTFQQQKYLQI